MISFLKKKCKNKLVLRYTQDSNYNAGTQWIYDKIKNDEEFILKKTFYFTEQNILPTEDEKIFNEVFFILGELENDYYKINGSILGIENDVYFYKKINVEKRHFIFYKNISIFRKIAEIIDQDLIIGGNEDNAITENEFNLILKKFPSKYEFDLYIKSRLSISLENFFELNSDFETIYKNYLNKKDSIKSESIYNEFISDDEIKYSKIYDKLSEMLKNEMKYNEKQWQEEISGIILLVFPKYIKCFREAPINDTKKNTNRFVDFLLLDSNGNCDILEIKKPFEDKSVVSKQMYRDNHIPLRELSGSIMQIEKYIFYLNKGGDKAEIKLQKKYEDELPEGFKIKIRNPSGLLLIGRENILSPEQKDDFEIIKRKYKNIIDIITYDELLNRLKFKIDQLNLDRNKL